MNNLEMRISQARELYNHRCESGSHEEMADTAERLIDLLDRRIAELEARVPAFDRRPTTGLTDTAMSEALVAASREALYNSFVRADQDVVCQICTRRYGDHPLDRKILDHEGNPFLHELCDGRRVKL